MNAEYLYIAIDASLRAGREILAIYNDPASDFQVERKADNSPLTIADRRSHEIISKALNQTPYPVLSEEGKHLPYEERKAWHTLWIVDPLDGTKEFIKRNGGFTVNIALVTDGVPVAGVIYVPVTKELYFAAEGLGAYKLENVEDLNAFPDMEKLKAASMRLPHATHPDFVVVASLSHSTPETEKYIARLRTAHPDLRLVTVGSSLKICLVAEGKADVYPRFAPTMEWDTAAGHAIARMAGFNIFRADGEVHEPLQYNKENLLNPWFIVERPEA